MSGQALRASVFLLCLWLVALVASLPAPAQARDIDPVPTQPSGTIPVNRPVAADWPMRSRIESILGQVSDFDLVHVRVDSGIVTLSGEVTDPASLDRLSRLISRVDGVVAIENEVQLTTDIGTRLGSVRDRFVTRLNQFVAGLPFVALGLAVGCVIVLLGGWLSRRRATLRHIAPNPFIADFLGQFIRLVSWIVALVVALDLMEATALLGTLLGAAGILGLSLSFAMRDTIENFVASILLSIRQPFRHNDLIEIQGHRGRVVRMTSRGTTLLSLDGNHIRIPNAIVYKAVLANFTRNPERRFLIDLAVDPAANLAALRDLALKTLTDLDFVLPSPEPAAWFETQTETALMLRAAGWVSQDGTDFDLARGEAFRLLRQALDAAGYAVPEPIHKIAVETSAPDRQTEPAPPATAPATPSGEQRATDLRPDRAFEQMVQRENDADRRDLLRRDQPPAAN